ncbi:hypothetical protein J6Z48_01130 [bacterium]|nr:hypothetical protein [bacterium]
MMKNIKKILLAVSVLFLLFNAHVNAATTIDTTEGWDKEVTFVESMVGVEGENVAQLVGKFLYGVAEYSFVSLCPKCTKAGTTIASSTNIPDYMKFGLTGLVDEQIIAMYQNVPYVDVVDNLASNWVPGYGGSNTTYASGYDDLRSSGISSVWSQTRNIALMFFVVVVIIVGFMIMFRNKIGGQMMVTIGNSIPNIILSIVLVVFSFAIMGLIIDLGGIILNFVKSAFGSSVEVSSSTGLFSSFLSFHVGGTGTDSLEIADIVTAILAGIFSKSGTTIVASTLSLIVGLLVLIIVLVGAIKLWLTLVKAYLGLVVDTIVSPLYIAISAIPGNDAYRINIFKSALRNVLVFPLTYAIVNVPYSVQKGVNLAFPSTLGGPSSTTGEFLMAIVKVVAMYAACSAPTILSTLIPRSLPKPKDSATGLQQSRLGRIPVIGGLFK